MRGNRGRRDRGRVKVGTRKNYEGDGGRAVQGEDNNNQEGPGGFIVCGNSHARVSFR